MLKGLIDIVNEIVCFPYEDIEEIPIVERHNQLKVLEKDMEVGDYNTVLFSLAVTVLNTAIVTTRNCLSRDQMKKLFLAISIIDYESSMVEDGFCIPSICVSGTDGWQKRRLLELPRKELSETPFHSILKEAMGISDCEILFSEAKEDIPERYYIVPSTLLR